MIMEKIKVIKKTMLINIVYMVLLKLLHILIFALFFYSFMILKTYTIW